MPQDQIVKLLEELRSHLKLRAEVIESEIHSANYDEFDSQYDRGAVEGLLYSAKELESLIKTICRRQSS
jgi:hypothetical protein